MEESMKWAVTNGDVEKCKALVDQGFSVKAELMPGRTAIHFAADYGQKDILEYLINNGAEINKEDKHGITPLLAAIFEGHTECCKLLINKGAKKDGKAPSGESYMEVAEKEEIRELLK